ncbi:MAG: class I SAM-dependent methyltransferase [Bacteroidales bacterium]|nr:class I SAM-dependent methyltransferase [Bacteroidales bacterium]
MNLDKVHLAAQKPELYEKGDSVIWTDEHISGKLLELHLNPEVDSASRSLESINRTHEFILSFCHTTPLTILDLGCGPGLYLERLAGTGHFCTGMDFSKSSIGYATNRAREKGLKINYIIQDYLKLDYQNQFDLIILIYTDLGVLLPDERVELLDRIYRALKPGGLFVFDVLNERNADQKFQEQQTWSYEFSGFWKPTPYLELASGFHYPGSKVFLKQHTIVDESDRIQNYRFWTHYFNWDDMMEILSSRGFRETEHFENILPARDIWDGENVTFYKTRK